MFVKELFEFKKMSCHDTDTIVSTLAHYGYLVEVREKSGYHHVVIYEKVDTENIHEPKIQLYQKAMVWENPK